jgi:hypothetical protein
MKLFLHIGTERTGSSHLQSLSAINRSVLQRNGIWFPSGAKKDILMMKGEISPGNAQNLTDALNTNNFTACKSFIAQRVKEAKEKNCHTLLLSNELLILSLAEDNRLSKFISMLTKMDISNIKFLLFLRDPVEHALSLYKHRAKYGNALDIEEWPKKHYVYGNALASFLNQAGSEKISLMARKFTKEKSAIEKTLFKECLNIHEDLIPPPKLVNPSLNLSELILIKKLNRHQSYFANFLSAKFSTISRKDKRENSNIVEYYKDSLSLEMANYGDTWKICNQFLPVNEKLSYPKETAKQTLIIQKNGCFSEQQIEAIVSVMADSLTLKGRFQIEKLKIKTHYGKLVRALKPKRKME